MLGSNSGQAICTTNKANILVCALYGPEMLPNNVQLDWINSVKESDNVILLAVNKVILSPD